MTTQPCAPPTTTTTRSNEPAEKVGRGERVVSADASGQADAGCVDPQQHNAVRRPVHNASGQKLSSGATTTALLVLTARPSRHSRGSWPSSGHTRRQGRQPTILGPDLSRSRRELPPATEDLGSRLPTHLRRSLFSRRYPHEGSVAATVPQPQWPRVAPTARATAPDETVLRRI